MTLTEFLLARIAEDEASARDTRSGEWEVTHERENHSDGSFNEAWGVRTLTPYQVVYGHRVFDYDDVVQIGHDRDYGTPEAACNREGDAAHIARWNPARVLVECEAKRRIIGLHWENVHGDNCKLCGNGDERAESDGWPCTSLRLLAFPYADHLDYAAEWNV